MDMQFTLYSAEANSGSCQTSEMRIFVKIVNDFQLLTIFGKSLNV